MIQLIKKEDQMQATIFGGRFITNKSVVQGGKTSIAPYSNLFYWSHARAVADVEFGLHGHEGFEIMTFILEGENTHYDTTSKVWTSLHRGDFQIIQSGSGLQHAEKITKGSRSFQIWFDPNFKTALSQSPAYKDYYAGNLQQVKEDDLMVTYYVGGDSPANVATEGLQIKKIAAGDELVHSLKLDINRNQHFYLLNGNALIGGFRLKTDDVLKVSAEKEISIILKDNAELFLIETPLRVSYETVWN